MRNVQRARYVGLSGYNVCPRQLRRCPPVRAAGHERGEQEPRLHSSDQWKRFVRLFNFTEMAGLVLYSQVSRSSFPMQPREPQTRTQTEAPQWLQPPDCEEATICVQDHWPDMDYGTNLTWLGQNLRLSKD